MKLFYKGLVFGEIELEFVGHEGAMTVNVYNESGKNVDVFSYAGEEGRGIEDYGTFRELCDEFLLEVERGER